MTGANLKYGKLFKWTKLIAFTGGAQVIVQATGLVCGIMVIRLLSTQEYAWYTLANTMLGTMCILADAGISTGVMALGGKVWQDKEKLGVIVATGLALRKKFAFVSLLIALPVLMFLLYHHDAGWVTIILIVASLIPAFFAALSDSLLEVVPKLNQNITALQKNQVAVGVGRLLLSGLSLFLFPFTFIAVFAAGICRIIGNIRLNKIVDGLVNKNKASDPEISVNILKIVKRILPGSIYYCISGQITIWLVSVFGNTSSIAKIGALGRLAMVLSVFSVLFNTLVTPRFARLPQDKKLLLTHFFKILLGLVILGFFIISICTVFSDEALWILGATYSNLKAEFVLSIIGSYIGLFAGILFAINTSRGWMINPLFSIPFNIFCILAGIVFLDLSSIKGLFTFNILIMGVDVLLYSCFGFIKIFKIKDVLKFA